MQRTALVLGVLLTVLAAPCWSAAGVDDYPMTAQAIAPGVYAVLTPARDFPNAQNKGWNSNSAFVVTDGGVLLFDTGTSQTIGEALKRAIAKVTDQPVRWIVNSHGHGDHWLGNAAFYREGVTIYASPRVKQRVETEGQEWISRFERMTDGATGHSDVIVPNFEIDERTEAVIGGLRVVFIPSGNSHSPGDILVWLPQRKVLLAGDVVYSDRMPSTFDSDVRQWIRFLGDLEAIKPVVVVPGHGAVTDAAALRRQREFLSTLWAVVKQGYEDGKTDFEIVPLAREALRQYKAGYPGFDDKLGRDVSHVYLQVEAALF
ncbi:MAG: MBL fold metallo-hydrolase [Pseudomonadota bacterium]|nr:MAG: MBL fold metallo-hydrolase [Pseudomonadota bacterium]